MIDLISIRETVRLLNLGCRDISSLISRSMDDSLPRSERWAVRLHLVYCSACRRYRRHVVFIQEAARRIASDVSGDETLPAVQLSPEARDRLKRSLEQ